MPARESAAAAVTRGSGPVAGPVITDGSVSWRIPPALVGDGVTEIDLSVDWALTGAHRFTRRGGGDWTL